MIICRLQLDISFVMVRCVICKELTASIDTQCAIVTRLAQKGRPEIVCDRCVHKRLLRSSRHIWIGDARFKLVR